jgi:hypothetical protein
MPPKIALDLADDDDRYPRLSIRLDTCESARDSQASPTHVRFYRPLFRPPVPILTVLDDGSMSDGDHVRLRGEQLVIGRTDTNVLIPDDYSMSPAHAEIRRVPWKGGFQWQLHDLDTVNGTFVRCTRAPIGTDTVIILGSRRFRLRNALSPSDDPVLAETSARPGAKEYPLRSARIAVGKMGGNADLEIDDALLDDHHATLCRFQDGTWVLQSNETLNGTWVSVTNIALISHCYFRCGEQLFRFVIP